MYITLYYIIHHTDINRVERLEATVARLEALISWCYSQLQLNSSFISLHYTQIQLDCSLRPHLSLHHTQPWLNGYLRSHLSLHHTQLTVPCNHVSPSTTPRSTAP